MKKYLFLLLLGFLIFSSCEEEIDYTKSFENEAITGNWNLYAIRSFDCGTFDVNLKNLSASDTIYNIQIDSTYNDSIFIDPVIGDTTFFDSILLVLRDTLELQGSAINEIIKDSIPKIDPVSGATIAYLNRYRLVENSGALFSVNYVFDTIFQEDVVQQYLPCESLFKFKSDGKGSYTTKVFGQSKSNGDLKWTDNNDGTFEICYDGDCKNYEATISSQDGLVLTDNNFDANDCKKATYYLNKQTDYFGEYVWEEVTMTDCYASIPDSVVVFSDLECDVDDNHDVTKELGAVCYRINIDCDDQGSFEIIGGPNEGVALISVNEIGDNKYKVVVNNGNQNINQFDAEIDGEFLTIKFENRTTLTGLKCNVGVKLKKQ